MPHWEQVDLNLLAPLAALLDEKHVSRAASRVHLSQPAMSRVLRRLRETLGDELLVRGVDGYQLTPLAERLQRKIAEVAPGLEDVFAHELFDPLSSTETFRLSGSDYAASVLGPRLFRHLFSQSPNSTVLLSAWSPRAFDDVERGSPDIVFCGVPAPRPLRTERLFEETFVCAMSADHPLARRRTLTLEDYLTCAHVVVDLQDDGQSAIERHLAVRGTPRHASLRVPYHFAAAQAVLGTNLVATLPRRLFSHPDDHPGTRLISAPAEIAPMSFSMAWHPRLGTDAAQKWLREQVRLVVQTLD